MNRQKIDGRKYRPPVRLYIALQDLDFSWYPWEVEKVRELWTQGKSVPRIGKIMDRDPDEVTLLIMSLAREKRISPRPGGALGISA
jgi:hypothetical protein